MWCQDISAHRKFRFDWNLWNLPNVINYQGDNSNNKKRRRWNDVDRLSKPIFDEPEAQRIKASDRKFEFSGNRHFVNSQYSRNWKILGNRVFHRFVFSSTKRMAWQNAKKNEILRKNKEKNTLKILRINIAVKNTFRILMMLLANFLYGQFSVAGTIK